MYNMNQKYQQCMEDEHVMMMEFTPSLSNQDSCMNDIQVNIQHGNDSSEDEKTEIHRGVVTINDHVIINKED